MLQACLSLFGSVVASPTQLWCAERSTGVVECVMRKSAVRLACLVVSWLLNLLDESGSLRLACTSSLCLQVIQSAATVCNSC